jgi:hypothetical protein
MKRSRGPRLFLCETSSSSAIVDKRRVIPLDTSRSPLYPSETFDAHIQQVDFHGLGPEKVATTQRRKTFHVNPLRFPLAWPDSALFTRSRCVVPSHI